MALYLSCQRAWRFKYLDRRTAPATPSLVLGKAFHDAVESQLVLIQGGEKHDHLTWIWRTAWLRAMEQGATDWQDETPEAVYNDGLRLYTAPASQELIRLLRPQVLPDGGLAIEQRIELRVPGVPIPVIGFIDLITDDGIPGDFKTASRAWTYDQAEKELQPLVYLAALNQAGRIVPELRFRHYVFVKTKEPRVQVIETVHRPAELFFLMETIRDVWRGIEGAYFPLNPTSWRCNSRSCAYWADCRGRR